jgi:chromatin assembly factor 1 subunit B
MAAQASASQTGVLSNPPLISGQVPSIAATNSSKVVGLPITTPPETPRGSFNASSGTKRDTAEGETDESSGSKPKRRRVAPTLVSGGLQPSGGSDDTKA